MRRLLLEVAVVIAAVIGTLFVQFVLEYRAWHRKMTLPIAKGSSEVEVIKQLGFPASIEYGKASTIFGPGPENCDLTLVRQTLHYAPEHGGAYRTVLFDGDHKMICESFGVIYY